MSRKVHHSSDEVTHTHTLSETESQNLNEARKQIFKKAKFKKWPKSGQVVMTPAVGREKWPLFERKSGS